MHVNPFMKYRPLELMKYFLFTGLIISSCTIPKKYQKGKPFITKNTIEVKGGNFSKEERSTLKLRLNAQLDDSSRINVIDKYFVRHVIVSPPAYDSSSAARSARNMETSMLHLGYYKARAGFYADTSTFGNQQRVHVNYIVEVNKPTLIDTFIYLIRKPHLQQLALQNMDKSLLQKNKPVTKAAVLGELSRLVDVYRNNGYYKFSTEELVMRGDTTVAALTTITDDIFEQLQLLAEAKRARELPTIKLAVLLNPPADSSKLKQFYINNIYILPDFRNGDALNDSSLTVKYDIKKNCDSCLADTNFIVRYRKYLFKNKFLSRHLYVQKGNLYNQRDFYKTLNSFTRAGVWQSTNIQIEEVKSNDSIQKIDLVVQLMPGKQYGYEASVEASYSASSISNNVTAANAGNLLGLSGNISFINRNLRKEGIKMTNDLRAGVEFNFRPDSNNTKNLINSNEISYTNNISFPRLVFPLSKYNADKHFTATESFVTTKLSYVNRINLFNLQSFNFGVGYSVTTRKNRQWFVRPLFNFEFARLYNESAEFIKTLEENPFLRYSFNTALVAGSSVSYRQIKVNSKFPKRQHSVKINLEESGLLWGRLGIFEKYMRQFVKSDIEYVYSASRPKSAFIFRVFGGIGIAAKKDTTLPFFKQYFGGGSNSMRGWPVRSIGRGAQPLAPYGSTNFNDRTGDIHLESNIEYRYNIAQIANSFLLRGALFADIGNVWNFRNTKPGGGIDSAQFQLKNLYKQLGVALGTGFRLDFNYFIVRFDFGFRFKRPDITENDGWQIPDINFNNLFKRGERLPDPMDPSLTYNDNRYKKWRYENYNLTIGISYPF